MLIIDVPTEMEGPLKELMAQISGQNGRLRQEEFLLWLKRVGFGHLVEVDRSLTADQAVNATGRVWFYKNQTELDTAPVSGSARVMLEIFELDYEPTPTELEAEYRSRGLTPDFSALCAYIAKKPEAADDRPIVCQWGLNSDGTAACAIFDRIGRDRGVGVGRNGFRWDRDFRFAGVRELSPVT